MLRFVILIPWFAGAAAAQTDRALPFEVVVVPGDQAQAEWHRLRNEPGTPVILGDQGTFDRIADFLTAGNQIVQPRTPEEILRLAEDLVYPNDLLQMRRDEHTAFLDRLKDRGDEDTLAYFADYDPMVIDDGLLGRRPLFHLPAQEIISLIDWETGENVDQAYIAILPTEIPWEAAAYLEFGGWNEHPPAEHHVAAMRAWYEAYGAEPVVMADDQMEMWVPHSPESWDEALSVATAQYHYDSDVVTQGVGTISTLAADRMLGTYWYFWWD